MLSAAAEAFPLRFEAPSAEAAAPSEIPPASADAAASAVPPAATAPTRVVAARHLPAGTVVCASAPACVIMTSPGVCSFCMARPPELHTCNVCKSHYCSRLCQKSDWVEHKEECKQLGALQVALTKAGEFDAALLLSRVARGKRLLPSNYYASPEAAAARPLELYTHTLVDITTMAAPPKPSTEVKGREQPGSDASSSSAPLAAAASAARIIAALRGAALLPNTIDDAVASALLALFTRHAVPVTDDLLIPRGVGVYPLGAQFAHSCAPNAVASYVDAQRFAAEKGSARTPALPGSLSAIQVIRTLVDVAEGEELLVAAPFVDVADTRADRLRAIRRCEGAAADCACAACSAEVAEVLMELTAASPDAPISTSSSESVALARLLASSCSELAEVIHAGKPPAAGSHVGPTYAKLMASGYLPPPPPPPAAGPHSAARSGAEQVAGAKASVLMTALRLTHPALPPFHPFVVALVKQAYGCAMMARDFGLAAPLGEHTLASYEHALRLPGGGATHPALALQWHALGDLYLNIGMDAAYGYDEEAAAAAAAAPLSPYEAGVAAVVAARLHTRPGRPPGRAALPEAFFAAAGEAYAHSARGLAVSFGRLCPLVSLAGERVETCDSIVAEAAERAAAGRE